MADGETTTEIREDEPNNVKAVTYREANQDGDQTTVAPQAINKHQCTRTSTDIRLFVAVFASTILLRGIVQQYILAVSRRIQRRYHIEENDLNFSFGVEKMAIVGTLLFVGYYGNATHKPIATFCGALLCAGGALVCAVPHFISGSLNNEQSVEDLLVKEATRRHDHPKNEAILFAIVVPVYATSGLCNPGLDNSAITSQCHQHPASLAVKGSFSLLCAGQFLMGVGGAFLATLGFMYVEESAKKDETLLHYGILLSMHGLGDAIGALLALAFTSLPEGISGDGGIAIWSPGAWWLALPLLCACLILPSPVFFMFPRWIKEPRWLRHRHNRKRKLEEKREARRLELVQVEKERRRRHRRRKKREMERQKQAAETGAINLEMSSAAENAAVSHVQDGYSRTGQDSYASLSADDIESHPINDGGASNHSLSDDNETYSVKGNGAANDGAKTSEDECEMAEYNDSEEHLSDGHEADVKCLDGHKHGAEMNGRQETGITTRDTNHEHNGTYSQSPSEIQKPSNTDTVETELPQTNDTEEDVMTETKELDTSKSEQQNRRRYALGRKLADLPRNMTFLMRQPVFALTACGAILWAYIHAGYFAVLPQYLQSQFYQSEQAAHTTAGVCFGLASSFGVVISSVATYRWSMTLVRQMALALVAMTVCVVILFILFAFGCEDAEQLIGVRSDESYFAPICTDSCGCSLSQYEPVCSASHERFASPCLAGCSVVGIATKLNYTGCSCVSEGEVSADWCQNCGTLVPFVLFLFVAVTAHGVMALPVLLIFLRKVPEKLRSLSLGFSLWLVMLISYAPGYTVYNSIAEEACLVQKETCYANDQCWQRDNKRHRFMLHGITVVFQVSAMLCFAGSWYQMRSKKIASSDASGVAKRTDTEQPTASLHLDRAPTQNSNETHSSSRNGDTATIHIATEGCSNLAFSDTDLRDARSEESKI